METPAESNLFVNEHARSYSPGFLFPFSYDAKTARETRLYGITGSTKCEGSSCEQYIRCVAGTKSEAAAL